MRFLLPVICVLLFGCRKDPALWTIKNLNNDRVSVFGHGGMGIFSRLPMNSEPSVNKSIEVGADGTEIDIQVSRDSVLIAFHDADLESSSTCEGTIAEKTWSELSGCEF